MPDGEKAKIQILYSIFDKQDFWQWKSLFNSGEGLVGLMTQVKSNGNAEHDRDAFFWKYEQLSDFTTSQYQVQKQYTEQHDK